MGVREGGRIEGRVGEGGREVMRGENEPKHKF